MPIGSLITPGAWGSATTFAVFGALTGAIAAACTLARIGEVDAIAIGRYCLGLQTTASSPCRGVDGVLYVFPGLAFGVVFGPLLHFRRQLGGAGAVAYALAAWVANAVAVSVSIAVLHPVDDLLPFDNLIINTATSGVIAGAVGGALLGAVLAVLNPGVKRTLPIAVAAGLGALTPILIMLDNPGVFVFYIVWQGGYAAALGASLPGPRPPDASG
jgi:hypothetical protein